MPTHHRDPRARRAGGAFAPPVDALAAAVRLEVAADAMRHDLLEQGPSEPGLADVIARRTDGLPFGSPHADEPLTAQEFADALRLDDDEPPAAQVEQAASPEPSSAAPHVAVTPPAPPTPAPPVVPAVFSNEHGRALTWASRHDPRSLDYGVRARLLAGRAPLQDVQLLVGPVLDQGAEGECVGCAVVDATNALRLVTLNRGQQQRDAMPLKLTDAAKIYHRAQQLDDVPGEDYTGTSVLAGMRAAVEAGYFGGYLWAFGTRDIADTLIARGLPVIIGVPWLSGMYDTGPGGLVEVTGDDTGAGHCLAVVGLRLRGPQGQPGPYFVWQNSWGASYGDGGLGYVHHRDLAGLLHGVGEAAIPTPGAPS